MGFFSKIKDAIVGNSAKQNDKYVAGLDKSSSSFSAKINELAARYREIDDDYFEELENVLIMSDVGVSMVMTIIDEIKKEVRLQNIKNPQMINDIIIAMPLSICGQWRLPLCLGRLCVLWRIATLRFLLKS